MPATTRTRSTLDILIGIVLVLVGAATIAYSAVATTVSQTILSWIPIAVGVSLVIAGIFRRAEEPRWWVRVTVGGLLIALGIVFLVWPATMKFTLTILAGVYFILSGTLRVISSYESEQHRLLLSVGGILSIVMGAVVLLSLRESSSLTLGLLIGAQIFIEGLTLAVTGTDPGRLAASRKIAARFFDDENSAPPTSYGTSGGTPVYEPPEITKN